MILHYMHVILFLVQNEYIASCDAPKPKESSQLPREDGLLFIKTCKVCEYLSFFKDIFGVSSLSHES